ncbi:MAG: helix-turn-helix domain-containing protein [Deltaproteobacteria bacterium]
MEKGFLTVDEVSQYLNIKRSTLYAQVSEIPHYKLGNLLRFKKEEIDGWMETKKVGGAIQLQVKKARRGSEQSIDSKNRAISIVQKAIDDVNGKRYNSGGKSDHSIRGLGKER